VLASDWVKDGLARALNLDLEKFIVSTHRSLYA